MLLEVYVSDRLASRPRSIWHPCTLPNVVFGLGTSVLQNYLPQKVHGFIHLIHPMYIEIDLESKIFKQDDWD